jgi:hypothetical protein
MLGTSRMLVSELVESVGYVAGHRHVGRARLVVPIEREAEVAGAGPLSGEDVE